MDKRVRAMYFSGTGTTAKVTSAVAYSLWKNLDSTEHKINVSGETDDPIDYVKAENINFTPATARNESYSFTADDIIVFGTPVIAGRVPNVLLKFLDTLQGNGAMVVPVVLFGNRNYDDALIELKNILESRGFYAVGGGAFIGEHSFSKVLAAGRPDADDMEVAEDFAGKLTDTVLRIMEETKGDATAQQAFFERKGTVRVKGHEPVRPYYQPRDRAGNRINILKVKPLLDKSRCTGCGICAEICPMGSIKADAPGVVEGICIKCCGCVKKCPSEALYYEDEGYLYHKEELELEYAGIRKEPEIFVIKI